MTGLPPGWRWTTLGEVAEVVGGVTKDSKSEGRPGLVEVPYLRVANVQRGRIDLTRVATIRVPAEKAARLTLQPGDVLLNEGGDRDKLGRGWVWDGQISNCIHQNHVFRARIRDKAIHPKLLAWYANEVAHDWFERNGKQSVNLASISLSKVRAFPLPVPAVAKQQRIVDAVEDNLSRLDAADNYLAINIRKTNAVDKAVLQAAMAGRLAEHRTSAYSRASQLHLRAGLCPTGMKRGRPIPAPPVGELAELPAHWVRVSLEEATHPVKTISYGILKPGPNLMEGILYVRVVDMRGDVVALDGLHRTSPEIAAKYDRSTLMQGDVLVSIRGTYGRVALVPDALEGANITQDTARLAFIGPIDPRFAATYLRSPQAQNYLKQVARGVAVKGVNIGDLRSMPFPIPSMAEQRMIIGKVAELSSEVDNARRTIQLACVRSRVLRRAILNAAFAGRLTGRASDMEIVEEMAGV